MNKLSKMLWALLPLLSVFIFVGCNNDEPAPEPAPNPGDVTINLKSETVNASANGGDYTVNYTLTNPIEGENVTVVPAEDWVSDIDVATPGVIKFSVERNAAETPRETTVDVSYKGAEKKIFTVKQAAAMNQDLTFEIEVTEQKYLSCVLDVYPANSDLAYIYGIYTPAEIEANNLQTDEALFQYEVEYFQALGYWNGISWKDVAEARAKWGNSYDVEPTGLAPESDYYLIAYYYDIDTCERLSDIYRFKFTTAKVPLGDMDFTFETSVDQNELTATVTAPTTYLDAFYFDVFQKSIVDSECAQLGIEPARYFELYNNTFVANRLSNSSYTAAGYIQEFCSYVSDDYTFDCLSDTEYYLYAFAVTEEGLCATVPVFEVVKTDPVEMSDNEFVIIVQDITTMSAKIMWKTVNDDPYIAGYVTKEYWDSLGSTDNQKLQGLLSTMEAPAVLSGDSTYYPGASEDEAPVYFDPATEYVVFAFGYRGGVVTTDLFSTTFSTLEDRESHMKLIVNEELGYFHIDAIKASDAYVADFFDNYTDYPFVAPFEVTFSDPSMLQSFFFTNWIENPSAPSEWNSPENIVKMVLNDGPMSPYLHVSMASAGLESYTWAMALDTDGYYTSIYERIFEPTIEGANPDGSIFAEWFYDQQNKSNALVPSAVYDNTPVELPALSQAQAVAPAKKSGKKHSLTTIAEVEKKLPVDCLVARE